LLLQIKNSIAKYRKSKKYINSNDEKSVILLQSNSLSNSDVKTEEENLLSDNKRDNKNL
jgi:hypothetical protein